MQSLTDLALGYLAIEDPGFAVDPMPHIEAARKAEQGRETHDLLDALIAANAEGRLNDYELRNLLIFLFAAGFDTSKNQLTFIMHVMLRHPELWQRCAEERDYCSTLTLAGRDPKVFPDPLVFNPDRVHTNRHMAFGRGNHLCLGMFLARAQIEEGVHLIAQRLTEPKLAGEVKWRPFPGVWGIRSLPIEFTPAEST